jgi:biotin carboxyl carrier protein
MIESAASMNWDLRWIDQTSQCDQSTMPGLILEISVVVGQTVKENDSLLILEAMKMEIVFLSPRDGIIKSISVGLGDTVDRQLLIEFE